MYNTSLMAGLERFAWGVLYVLLEEKGLEQTAAWKGGSKDEREEGIDRQRDDVDKSL